MLVAATAPEPPASVLRDDVKASLDKAAIPGAAVGVVLGDRLVFAEGFGVASVETGAAVTPETLFQIGSLTKLFTATAVLVAAEQGKLSLDAPIGERVKGLAPCLARLTVTQLLSHTAGLLDEPDEYGPHDESALGEYIRSWKDDVCLLPAGRAFSYSNSGYALAGLVLQEAYGKPYADAMQELVLTPLGMGRTTFRPTVAMTYPLAVGHRLRDGRAEVVRPMADDARLWPAGEIYTCLRDLTRFALAFLNDGMLEGRAVLSSGVIARLRMPRAEVPALGSRYGFGLMLDAYRGSPREGHAGTMPGFAALFTSLPGRRAAVLVLANREARLDDLGERLLDALLFRGEPRSQPVAAPELAVTESEAGSYAGRYTNPRRFTLEIVRGESGLLLRAFGRDLPMRKVGERRFEVRRPGAPAAEPLVLGGGGDGPADYLQFAYWSFIRTR